MKFRKQFKKISLISLILIVLVGCCKISYGADLKPTISAVFTIGKSAASSIAKGVASGVLEGIVGVLALGIQQLAVLIFGALHLITMAITGISGDGSAATIGDVVFNRCGLTSANFFPQVWVGDNIKFGTASIDIVNNISKYYYIIRNLSIAILLGILLYVGIRMAISTVASEEAKYKKMLKDWAISLVLVFVLHYIIILTFFANNVLVNALSKLDTTSGTDYAGMIIQGMIPGYGMADVIVYGAFVTGTLAFVLMYLKRTIVLGFLIVISPLITITYSIDKMGDGKSQALNNWLKEFIFSVIIQPFHCIIYLVFYASIMKSLSGASELDLGNTIFAIASVFFMLKAEGIVKKIFGIQPNSIGDALGTGAMALTMATSMFKGRGKKIVEGKGDIKEMKNNSSSSTTGTSRTTRTDGTTEGTDTTPAGPDAPGGTGTPDTTGGTTDGSTSAGPAPADPATVSPETDSSVRETISESKKSFKDWLNDTGYMRRRGGTSEWLGRRISGAATLAGFIAGGTVGDFRTASSVATAAGGIARNVHDDLKYKAAERKLEKNQQVFAGAYEDFAREYRSRYAGASDEDIRAAAKKIFDGGGQDLRDDYEKDFYNQMEQLSDSAEIMGYKDGFDYVNDSMRLTAEGVIEHTDDYVPKYYGRRATSGTGSTGTPTPPSPGGTPPTPPDDGGTTPDTPDDEA